jgi:ADP-ribose pyrophosphatase YjhB (NUDIX family)
MTPLVLSCFLTDKQPPVELIVSARAVLIAQDSKVFVFDDQGMHVLPGGRRQKEESVLAALAREIREEVGCDIVGDPRPIGFFELRNDGPRPEVYPYPYPRNYHVVFKVSAGPVTQAPVDPNVHDGRFVLRDEALAMGIPWAERVFLEALSY